MFESDYEKALQKKYDEGKKNGKLLVIKAILLWMKKNPRWKRRHLKSELKRIRNEL